PDNSISVRYDNRNFTFDDAADVSLSVFTTTDCTNPAAFTLVGCSDIIPDGVEGEENVLLDALAPNQQYFIRVVNKATNKSAFGNICVLWGETQGVAQCPPSNSYGELEGVFKNFEVLGDWTANVDVPTDQIIDINVPCVIPGGSSNSNDPPVRSQGWLKFEVPAGFAESGVTVQYDNSNFTRGKNTQNSALAVYEMPNNPTGDGNCAEFNPLSSTFDPDNPMPNDMGLQLLGCVNSVFEGTESLSVPVEPNTTYFVRVMNINGGNGDPEDMPGQIRVFPVATCEVNINLVTNGDFENWPAIEVPLGSEVIGDYDATENPRIHTNPFTKNADRGPFIANRLHFATDYGYVRDSVGINANDLLEQNSFEDLRRKQNELDIEGLYAVSQSSWTYKKDWFGYGFGYSGYGGRFVGGGQADAAYCASGSFAQNGEPCVEVFNSVAIGQTIGAFGDYEANRVSLMPTTAESNYMIVNGSFNPADNLPPGKVWCQTIDRGAVTGVGYYVFSVWVQNMNSGGKDLEVPLLRMTVCDMEDPNTPGIFPAQGVSGTVSDPGGNLTRLPGLTTFDGDTANHIPAPIAAYDFEFPIFKGRQAPYGASVSCNLPGEPRDFRLKVLGSPFLISERPDKWNLMRCIYRAEPEVQKANICIENLSRTRTGNDFGIDNVIFGECIDADPESMERLLRGNPCELALGASATDLIDPGGPLIATALDFNGKLIGEAVYLNWLVINEQNVSQYEIQRSFDGQNFVAIGQVDSKFDGSNAVDYGFTDDNLPDNQNYAYYRLRVLGTNGTSKIANVIRVDISDLLERNFTIVPNPTATGSSITIQFEAAEGKGNIKVTSVMGSSILLESLETENGRNEYELSTKGLAPGVYILTLYLGGKPVSKRFVVY
ncbi:MAG: T9SS type A sorting domain-containing protein, partial [Bacteroidota bacterium]